MTRREILEEGWDDYNKSIGGLDKALSALAQIEESERLGDVEKIARILSVILQEKWGLGINFRVIEKYIKEKLEAQRVKNERGEK